MLTSERLRRSEPARSIRISLAEVLSWLTRCSVCTFTNTMLQCKSKQRGLSPQLGIGMQERRMCNARLRLLGNWNRGEAMPMTDSTHQCERDECSFMLVVPTWRFWYARFVIRSCTAHNATQIEIAMSD